ncbi:hypothetical protein predicted by Glimmer/Critica [Bdellovibrio bacteriovorus HD100]|uniref:Uncharacterized protein n=1 Tax=Bdellovibrio bacteriovorus (strain ATCC 15356 / DSM 50701 / NCIMB 9529 / HD100) TaxID=264462 RepID=Q6MN46_BDEBA|nr:hypothetical protein predicted by Glimmer/Critica [Bdellovibrio bacteriovorus HD100]
MGQRKFAGELGQCQREGGFVGAWMARIRPGGPNDN